MKKIYVTLAWLFCLAATSMAQVKVWTNGNVVVGSTSTSPNKPLDVVASGGIRISQTADSSNTNELFFQQNGQIRSTDDNHRIIFDQSGNKLELREFGNIVFSPGSTGKRTQKMTLTNNGSLLLGTATDPGSTSMDITAPSNYRALYSTTTFSADYAYHQVNNVNRGYTKAFVVQLSGSDKIILYGNGSIWSNGSWITSDKTLKENIDTIANALVKIKQLKGVTYTMKTSYTGLSIPKREMGLLAQDVELVIPEVVSTNDKGLKAIAYPNLVALLIEAIKAEDAKINLLQHIANTNSANRTAGTEQNANNDISELKKLIEAQQKDIEALKKQNAELSSRMEQLKNK